MKDLGNLESSVARTLSKARQRTGVGGKRRRHADSAPSSVARSDGREDVDPARRLERELRNQRAVCADLKREIGELQAQRHEQDRAAEKARVERDRMEERIEVTNVRIELTQRRGEELERTAAGYRDQLADLRANRMEVTRSVLEARDALESLSARLEDID